jgi:hypothetical protein
MDGYMRLLHWSLDHRYKVVFLGGGAALAATVLAFMSAAVHLPADAQCRL